jgi:hypothetical protein
VKGNASAIPRQQNKCHKRVKTNIAGFIDMMRTENYNPGSCANGDFHVVETDTIIGGTGLVRSRYRQVHRGPMREPNDRGDPVAP